MIANKKISTFCLIISISFSIILLGKYLSLTPIIASEKVSHLNFLWDTNISDYKKLFLSCSLDACIGRFRPLNYTLEFIDSLFVNYIIISTGHVSWKPITNFILILLCPLIFFISNKKTPLVTIIVSALFFSSFQFLSNSY